jgi:GntR family transcriptional regulator
MNAPLEQGPVPLYYQLEQHLRARIVGDEFTPGVPLPTEDQICDDYKVSRITVRRALDGLQRQGLIERRRGVGSFVAEKPRGINSHLTGSLNQFLAQAGSLSTRCIFLGEGIPCANVRAQLGLEQGDHATLLKTIGSLDEGPVAYLEIWFPLSIGTQLKAEDLDGHLPVVRLVEQVANVRITRAEQTIEPDMAGEDAARHLQIDANTPILHVQRVYFAGDRPIEMANARYHPDRYRYAIEFKG